MPIIDRISAGLIVRDTFASGIGSWTDESGGNWTSYSGIPCYVAFDPHPTALLTAGASGSDDYGGCREVQLIQAASGNWWLTYTSSNISTDTTQTDPNFNGWNTFIAKSTDQGSTWSKQGVFGPGFSNGSGGTYDNIAMGYVQIFDDSWYLYRVVANNGVHNTAAEWGLDFGPYEYDIWVAPTAAASTVTFVKTDTTTSGTWYSGTTPVYGGDGYVIVGQGSTGTNVALSAGDWYENYPDYATVTIQGVAPFFVDPNFQQPNVGTGNSAYDVNPTGAPWTYSFVSGSAGSGVCGNSSAYNNPTAPVGTQVAYIQLAGTISQAVTFPTAGTFQISVVSAQRDEGGVLQSQEIEVLIDGVSAGSFTPTSASWATYTSSNFTVAAGSHTIEFKGLNPQGGDNTAFLTEAAIHAVTPSWWLWSAPTSSVNALEYAPPGTSTGSDSNRVAATWSSNDPNSLTIDIQDGNEHQIALYCVDYDNKGRNQTITVTDDLNNSATLDTRTISSFQDGVWLVWKIMGKVTFTISDSLGNSSGVVSGIFFDTPSGSGTQSGSDPPLIAEAWSFREVVPFNGASWDNVGVNPGSTVYDGSGTYYDFVEGTSNTTPVSNIGYFTASTPGGTRAMGGHILGDTSPDNRTGENPDVWYSSELSSYVMLANMIAPNGGSMTDQNAMLLSTTLGGFATAPAVVRFQHLCPMDSSNAIGVPRVVRNSTGAPMPASDGCISFTFDANPPTTYNGGTNSPGYHLGREALAAVFEPSAKAARYTGTSTTVYGSLVRNVTHADFVAEFAFQCYNAVGSGGQLAFDFRSNGGGSSWNGYRLMLAESGGMTLQKFVGGSVSQSWAGAGTQVFELPLTNRIRLSAIGSAIQAWLDGESQINITDSSYTTGTQVAFSGVNASSALDVRLWHMRTGNDVTVQGLANGTTVILRDASGLPVVSATASGGSAVLSGINHGGPYHSIDVGGTNYTANGTGDNALIWAGDVFSGPGLFGSASVSLIGSVTAQASPTLRGEASASLSGSVAGRPSLSLPAQCGVSFAGSASAAPSLALAARTSLALAGSVSASGRVQQAGVLYGSASVSLKGSVQASPALSLSGKSAVTSSGSVSAQVSQSLSAKASVALQGTASARPSLGISGRAAVSLSAEVSAAASVFLTALAGVSLQGTIAASGLLPSLLYGRAGVSLAGAVAAAGVAAALPLPDMVFVEPARSLYFDLGA